MCGDWGTGSMAKRTVSRQFSSTQRRREHRGSAEKTRNQVVSASLRLSLRSLRLCVERSLLVSTVIFAMAAQSDGERQLETAVYRETVTGDVASAIGMYRSILAEKGITRPVAARALWQLGQCQEKLGQRREAHATYVRVVREFASESGIAAQARGKLAGWSDALPGPRNLRFEEGDAGKTPPGWFVPQVEKVSGSLAELRRKGCRS